MRVSWVVEIGDEFGPEFDELREDVRAEILALARLLQQFGPQLGRPRVDTLKDSRCANMKGWRVEGGLCFRYEAQGDPFGYRG
jgi:hypothetical protein